MQNLKMKKIIKINYKIKLTIIFLILVLTIKSFNY